MIQKIQVAILLLLVPVGVLYLYVQSQNISLREIFTPATPVVRVGDIGIRVEIVDTPEKRVQGLSGRTSLEGVDGMLFIFDEPGYHEIWMKDMKFPIDIIWIDENLTVVSIDQNVSPDSYPQKYRPERPALYAIETPDRYTDTFGIRPGVPVQLPLRVTPKTGEN